MVKYFFTWQFLRFLAVGGLAALMNWLSRLVLSLWLSFPLAVVVAYGIGMLVAFLLNSYFVFPKSVRARHEQARDFVLVNLLFFPVVWFAAIKINNYLVSIGFIKFSHELAHAIAIALPMMATFLMYKFVAFKEKQHGRQ